MALKYTSAKVHIFLSLLFFIHHLLRKDHSRFLLRSVLVDPEQPDFVEGGQFRDEHKRQADCVEYKVHLVVFRVSTGQDEEQDGDNGEEFSGWRVLDPVVDLFPVGQTATGALIKGDPRMGFHLKWGERVKERWVI